MTQVNATMLLVRLLAFAIACGRELGTNVGTVVCR